MEYLIECIKCGLTERNTIFIEAIALDKINRFKGEVDLIPCALMAFCMLYLCAKGAVCGLIDRMIKLLKWMFWIK